MHKVDINLLLQLSQNVGQGLLSFYRSNYDVQQKADKTLVTTADQWAHREIVKVLESSYPHIPLLSEENNATHAYEVRQHWEYFFLIDPLDGTKEFINKNGEFTINMALIYKTMPMMGLIYVPMADTHYYAIKDKGAFKLKNQQLTRLPSLPSSQQPRLLISRSHACVKTQQYMTQKPYSEMQVTPMGSALKFGKLAESSADVYLRYTPTMEWDTAAGHLIAMEAGKKLQLLESDSALTYNKPSLINPGFIIE